MNFQKPPSPILFVIVVFLICGLFRGLEYFLLRTDQSIVGEAIVHKLAGIAVLFFACRYAGYSAKNIGFKRRHVLRHVAIGAAMGVGFYLIAYGVEFLMLRQALGEAPQLRLYATSYAIQGNTVMESGLVFILICIVGNIVNVIMEEGLFRGLFVHRLESRYSFVASALASSFLFGIWHIAQPMRNMLDGVQSVHGALISALMLVVTSMLAGIQFCMLLKITGSIWMSMTVHFIGNTAVNLIHMVSATGVDEMQTMRITIFQTASFIVVLAVFIVILLRERKLNSW